MVNFIKTQNSFRHGELAKEFFSTGDVHGVSHLENMDIVANGALVRRPGLQRIYDLGATSGRLITFSVDEDEEYLIVLSNGIAKIFFHGEAFQTLVVPWSEEDIPLLQYTQKFGTMIFVHPDYSPRVLYKSGATLQLREFTFAYTPDQTNINMPFTRYEDTKDITITVTYPVDGVHMKTNKNFWTANHVGGCLSLLGKTWIINSYIGPKEITAVCTGIFTVPADPVSDWKEATFSATRGWPSCVTFHQDRLVFGGAKSWPGGVWMSKVGQHENFDLGTGLDDEAIFFTIVSDRRQQICTLISSNGCKF